MLRIVRAPVGNGKTERALKTLTAATHGHSFARVWVLLATRRQEDAFRQRLIDLPDGPQKTYFNVEFFDFYQLYRYLLNLAAQPSRELSDAARYAIMRAVILEARPALAHFTPIAERAGFARVVADFVYELKQNLIEPQTFITAARDAKDRDLAHIYNGYQNKLRAEHLVDREGEGWLALATLRDITAPQGNSAPRIAQRLKQSLPNILIVDGFDQFNPLQVALLAELSRHTDETLVTLTRVPQREQTIGRRFEQAFDALSHAAQNIGLPLEVETLDGAETVAPPDVQHLIRAIFAHDVLPVPLRDGLTLVEEPDVAGEVAAVLRRIKALLVDGTPPDSVLVALRDWALYQPYFLAYAAEFGVPLALHYGESLAAVPVIRTVLDALQTAQNGFTRRDVLALLKSPYTAFNGLDALAVARLEAVSLRGVVVRGRDQWLEALRLAVSPVPNDDDAENPTALFTEDTRAALESALTAFFDALTPPPDTHPLPRFVEWLENLIALESPDGGVPHSLNIYAQARAGGDDALQSRDLQALEAFRRLLQGMLKTQKLVQDIFKQRGEHTLRAADFLAELRLAVDAVSITPQPNRTGRVLVTSAADARGLPHEIVFVLGLSEGVFPAPIAPDPLYLDSERMRLTADGVTLKPQTERATDDGLFYELMCLPRRALILSRPTTQDGALWEASHLWRAVCECFTLAAGDVQRRRAGQTVAPHEAASLVEFSASAVSDAHPQARAASRWLAHAHADYWTRIQTAASIEQARLSPDASYDSHSGRLSHAPLLTHVNEVLGARSRWSASRLKTFGQSPYQFFARYLLRLEAADEPEEGMDALQRGTLVHEILERVYQAVQAAQMPITPDNQAAALALFDDISADVLRDAPRRLGFRAAALWTQERAMLSRSLRQLIARDFGEAFVNQAMGLEGERRVWALEVAFPEGTRLDDVQLVGRIDRIDQVGDALIVMDYKTGSRRYDLNALNDGVDFQMLLYLRAAEAYAAGSGLRVHGGFFWGVERCDVKGRFIRGTDKHSLTDEDADAAQARILAYVAAARAGQFCTFARKPTLQRQCADYCDYTGLCRLCGLIRRDGDPCAVS